jgi:hypothetical protein
MCLFPFSLSNRKYYRLIEILFCLIDTTDTLEWTKVPDSENAPTPRSEHAATVVDDKYTLF